MKILQLTNKTPIPPKEGGSQAMYHLASALMLDGYQIDVLSIVTPKMQPQKTEIEKYAHDNYSIDFVFVDTTVRFWGVIKSLLKKESYHVSRFDSEDFRKTLIAKLHEKKYDVVLFETIFMAPYLETVRQHSNALCFLRAHNVEHKIWERYVQNEKNFLKKHLLSSLTARLKSYELLKVFQFDAIACISNQDENYFKNVYPVCICGVIPFGIPLKEVNIKHESSDRNVFYHIGSMDWLPNVEGIRWFLQKVVPILEAEAPEIRISLAGRNMPEWVYQYRSEMVEVVGEVNDADEYLSDKSVLIVPLLSGSGIRIKIIEAMAAGKAVVATPIGAEGIFVEHEKNILLADTPRKFADAMIFLHQNPHQIKKLGTNARLVIADHHTYDCVSHSFKKLHNKVFQIKAINKCS